MIGFYNYTTWLTYLSLISSITGIFLCINGDAEGAVFCLMLSGFLDTFDGKVARSKKNRTEKEKSFGIQIDSLTDLICFGVLPICIGYTIGLQSIFWSLIFALYTLAGMIRLAFFNVLEEHSKYVTFEKSNGYVGLPITTASLIFPLAFLSKIWFGPKSAFIYGFCLIIVACLFVSKFRIKKPNAVILSFLLVFGTILLSILIFYLKRK